jgi:hypothetical protein
MPAQRLPPLHLQLQPPLQPEVLLPDLLLLLRVVGHLALVLGLAGLKLCLEARNLKKKDKTVQSNPYTVLRFPDNLTSCLRAWMLLARFAAVSTPLEAARSLMARGEGGSDTGWSNFTWRDLKENERHKKRQNVYIVGNHKN